MVSKWRFALLLLGVGSLFSPPLAVHAGLPEVKNLMVTDVTTVSFSAVWVASEASTADIEVFEDEAGTVPVSTAVVTPHPIRSGNSAIRDAAENNGVMKVMVTGLEADREYYFRTLTTSKSTFEATMFPGTELWAVTTEVMTMRTVDSGSGMQPFSNDVISEPCFLEDGVTPAEGTLLVATVANADYPLTAFVGDGIALPYALIDLNNAFSRETNETLNITGGGNLTLVNLMGFEQASIVTREVPDNSSSAEIKPGEFYLKTGWNFVSVQVIPISSDLQSALSGIWDVVTAVWTYDAQNAHWQRYIKDIPFPWLNDLGTIEFGRGYWIEVSQNCALKVHGILPEDPQIPLIAGWNQVGYRSIETLSLAEATSSIEGNYQSIWTYRASDDEWLRYIKDNPFPWFNNLETVMPGQAYWVEVTEDTQW